MDTDYIWTAGTCLIKGCGKACHPFGAGVCTLKCWLFGTFWGKAFLFGEKGRAIFHILGFCTGVGSEGDRICMRNTVGTSSEALIPSKPWGDKLEC